MLEITNIRVDNGRLSDAARIIDNHTPLFSWSARCDQENAVQSAYKVKATSGDIVLCETDFIESPKQEFRYNSKKLPLAEKIYITVWIKDNSGNTSEAFTDFFYYGKLDEWRAPWVAPVDDAPEQALYFRKTFHAHEVKSACLFTCGLGLHKIYVNGREADEAILQPAVSDYTKSCYYVVTPEIENLLSDGANEILVVVAEGWRRNPGKYLDPIRPREVAFFGNPQLSMQLRIVHNDNSVENIFTDQSFLVANDGEISANLFSGETYDARKERTYRPVRLVPPPKGRMLPQIIEPVFEQEQYAPRQIYAIGKDSFIVDFGQNIAGYIKIRLPHCMKRGQEITIHHSEELNSDGDLDKNTLRNAKCIDVYISDGQEHEYFKPTFTYHGFRYAKIEGYGRNLRKDDLVAISIYSNIKKESYFKCGSSIVNCIWQNIAQTEKANIHGIFTDCPQRDERMGWFNDATVRFLGTPYSFDVGKLYPKVVADVIDTQDETGAITCTAPFVYGQRPADPVCSAYIVAGIQNYLHNGDIRTLKNSYDSYKKWQMLLLSKSDNYLLDYSYYGDWAGPVYACRGGESALDGVDYITGTLGTYCESVIDSVFSKYTESAFMSTGFFYYNAKVLAEIAKILGEENDCIYFSELRDKIQNAFLKKWYDEKTGKVGGGGQGCQALALWLGILPEGGRAQAAKLMRDDLVARNYKITTANLTTTYLFEMLAEYGYIDEAWEFICSEEYPSFGFMLQQEATTIWERFELKQSPEMNSHCHPMYGAAGLFLYTYIVGIKPMSKNFETFNIKPHFPKKLLSASACVDTPMGQIYVKWKKRFGKIFLNVDIPFGTCANVYFGGAVHELGNGFWNFEQELTNKRGDEE